MHGPGDDGRDRATMLHTVEPWPAGGRLRDQQLAFGDEDRIAHERAGYRCGRWARSQTRSDDRDLGHSSDVGSVCENGDNDAGVWVWHCHILTHVERTDGMFGMVTAIIVNETPGFDPSDHPVEPHNWENTTTSPDGPVPADGAHSHGEGEDGSHSHGDDGSVDEAVTNDEEDQVAA